jgi:hypothetical protein
VNKAEKVAEEVRLLTPPGLLGFPLLRVRPGLRRNVCKPLAEYRRVPVGSQKPRRYYGEASWGDRERPTVGVVAPDRHKHLPSPALGAVHPCGVLAFHYAFHLAVVIRGRTVNVLPARSGD